MKLRHEYKHQISRFDLYSLGSRLSAVMQTDAHSINGLYKIRSLYFDNIADKALREKLDGVDRREKFRIRYYNGDLSYICLEKKTKINGLCAKEQELLLPYEAKAIADGNMEFMSETDRPLLRELYVKMKTEGLAPKVLVDYTRRAYVHPAGNTRVTLDYDIRTGLTCKDMLNVACPTIPAGDDAVILEVKWDEFLPSVIRDIVQTDGAVSQSFSKYAACRIYG